MVFGHPIRSCVPAHRRSFAAEWQEQAEECDYRASLNLQRAKQTYDSSAHPLKPLKIGVDVCLQDPISRRWDNLGTIVSVGYHRDYLIKTPSGKVFWRNRRFLRPSLKTSDNPKKKPPSSSSLGAEAPTRRRVQFQLPPPSDLRRSQRHRGAPNRLGWEDCRTDYPAVPKRGGGEML